MNNKRSLWSRNKITGRRNIQRDGLHFYDVIDIQYILKRIVFSYCVDNMKTFKVRKPERTLGLLLSFLLSLPLYFEIVLKKASLRKANGDFQGLGEVHGRDYDNPLYFHRLGKVIVQLPKQVRPPGVRFLK